MSESNGSAVVCAFCWRDVVINGGRGVALLICGHRFHLQCITSMFNARGGVMQCPICWRIEHGNWRLPQVHGLRDEIFVEVPHAVPGMVMIWPSFSIYYRPCWFWFL